MTKSLLLYINPKFDKKQLKEKIESGMKRFSERTGEEPSSAYVHPNTLHRVEDLDIKLDFVPSECSQNNHLYIFRERENDKT